MYVTATFPTQPCFPPDRPKLPGPGSGPPAPRMGRARTGYSSGSRPRPVRDQQNPTIGTHDVPGVNDSSTVGSTDYSQRHRNERRFVAAALLSEGDRIGQDRVWRGTEIGHTGDDLA